MAAITNATTATSIANTKQSEVINALVRYTVQTPHVWMGVAHVPPELMGTAVYRHPYWPALTAAAAHTETDFDNVEELVAAKDNDVTTAEFSRAWAVGDRAKRLSLQDLLAVGVNRVINACHLKIEASVLALATSISTNQGSAATVHTQTNLVSVLSAFMAQGKSSVLPPVMVSSVSANRDLLADLSTSSASIFGSIVGAQMHDALSGMNQGIYKQLGASGVYMAVTDGVATADTTGKGNFIVHVGPEECAIVCAFGKAPSAEYVRRGDLLTDIVVGSVDFGVGLVNQARAYEFVTRA